MAETYRAMTPERYLHELGCAVEVKRIHLREAARLLHSGHPADAAERLAGVRDQNMIVEGMRWMGRKLFGQDEEARIVKAAGLDWPETDAPEL